MVNGKAVPTNRAMTNATDMNLYASYTKLTLNLGEILDYTPEASIGLTGKAYLNSGNQYQQAGFYDQGYAAGYKTEDC